MREVFEIPLEKIKIGDRARIDLGDIERLQQSITDRGLIHAITISKENNELIDGFRRFTCHKNLGLPTIEARYFEELSPVEKKIMELEANLHEPMKWDEEATLRAMIHELRVKERGRAIKGHEGKGQSLEDTAVSLGVSVGTLSQDISLVEAMKVAPKIAQFSSKKQALKALNKMKEMAILTELARRDAEQAKLVGEILPYSIVNGDAIKLAKENLEDNTVDLVIFDPGWGIDSDVKATSRGPRGEKVFYDDSTETSTKFTLEMLPEIYRVMKDGSHMYMFVGSQFASYWSCYLMNLKMEMKPGELPTFSTLEKNRPWQFDVRLVPLVWIKEGGGYTDHEYKIMPRYETVLFCSKGIRRLNYAVSDVFEHNRPLSTERIHVHQKSLELYKDFIKVSSLSNEVVFDPCMGSGVMVVAAILTGRRAIGFEKDKEAYMKAENWIKGIRIPEEEE